MYHVGTESQLMQKTTCGQNPWASRIPRAFFLARLDDDNTIWRIPQHLCQIVAMQPLGSSSNSLLLLSGHKLLHFETDDCSSTTWPTMSWCPKAVRSANALAFANKKCPRTTNTSGLVDDQPIPKMICTLEYQTLGWFVNACLDFSTESMSVVI